MLNQILLLHQMAPVAILHGRRGQYGAEDTMNQNSPVVHDGSWFRYRPVAHGLDGRHWGLIMTNQDSFVLKRQAISIRNPAPIKRRIWSAGVLSVSQSHKQRRIRQPSRNTGRPVAGRIRPPACGCTALQMSCTTTYVHALSNRQCAWKTTDEAARRVLHPRDR